MGVPNTSIQQKMQIDGFTEKDINTFLNPPLGATITTNTTTATTAPKPTTTFTTTSLGTASTAATGAGAGAGIGGGKYDKYRKMLSMNIPEMAVRRKMTQVHSVVYDIVCDV